MDEDFIHALLDMCEEARTRAMFSRKATTRERGKEIVRKFVRLACDLCSDYDILPADVDRRLVEAEYIR